MTKAPFVNSHRTCRRDESDCEHTFYLQALNRHRKQFCLEKLAHGFLTNTKVAFYKQVVRAMKTNLENKTFMTCLGDEETRTK